MVKEQALAVSLEEFGLGKYEAKAYVALISRGTISASELAYYADIPRTKAYSTLLKLEKKKLAILSKSKPIMCTGVAPEGAFDGIIHEQINKVNAMNSLVSGLKQLSEESKKSNGSEEKRYFHILASSVLDKLKQMIEGSKESILIASDPLGLSLLAECREQLAAVARRGLDVRMIIPPSQVGSETCKKIPDGVKIRAAENSQNCLVFDQTEVLFIDSDNGKAAVFSSTEVMCSNQIKMFAHMWKTGLKTESVADMTKTESQEIYRIIKTVSEHGLNHMLNTAYVAKNKQYDMLDMLEKNGISFGTKTLDDVMEIMDSVMQITCSGHANFDTKNKNISIESRLNSGHSLPWANMIDMYLQNRGYRTRLVYQNNNQKGEKVHIKIQKKN